MSRRIYAAPWAEPLVLATEPVELVPYGPSAEAYARQHSRHRDWSWRPRVKRPAPPGRDVLRGYMRGADGVLREGVPERELEVYLAVVEQGHSTRWAARALGVSRASAQVYLRRLRARATRVPAVPRPPATLRTLAIHAERIGRTWCQLRAAT